MPGQITGYFLIFVCNTFTSVRRFIVSVLVLLSFCGPILRAQDRDDFGIWQDIDVGAKLSERWTGGLWFEHRSKGDAKVLDCALVMPYLDYKLSRFIHLNYASEFIQTLNGWYITCRPSVSLYLGEGNLSFTLRELPIYTHCCADGSGKWTLRTRGKVAYSLPQTRLKPYLSCELFTARHWEKTRYYLGTSWSFGNHSTLDLFYLYYVMAGMSTQRHVLGLGYAFKI